MCLPEIAEGNTLNIEKLTLWGWSQQENMQLHQFYAAVYSFISGFPKLGSGGPLSLQSLAPQP